MSVTRPLKVHHWVLIVIVSLAVVALSVTGILQLAGGADESGKAWGTRLGLFYDGVAQPVVLIEPCNRDRVVSVSLFSSDSAYSRLESKLWSVNARDSRDATRIQVGSTPPGFSTSVPLTAPPSSDQPVVVQVQTSGESGSTFSADFRYRDLVADRVLVPGPGYFGSGAVLDRRRFAGVAGRVCANLR